MELLIHVLNLLLQLTSSTQGRLLLSRSRHVNIVPAILHKLISFSIRSIRSTDVQSVPGFHVPVDFDEFFAPLCLLGLSTNLTSPPPADHRSTTIHVFPPEQSKDSNVPPTHTQDEGDDGEAVATLDSAPKVTRVRALSNQSNPLTTTPIARPRPPRAPLTRSVTVDARPVSALRGACSMACSHKMLIYSGEGGSELPEHRARPLVSTLCCLCFLYKHVILVIAWSSVKCI